MKIEIEKPKDNTMYAVPKPFIYLTFFHGIKLGKYEKGNISTLSDFILSGQNKG